MVERHNVAIGIRGILEGLPTRTIFQRSNDSVFLSVNTTIRQQTVHPATSIIITWDEAVDGVSMPSYTVGLKRTYGVAADTSCIGRDAIFDAFIAIGYAKGHATKESSPVVRQVEITSWH